MAINFPFFKKAKKSQPDEQYTFTPTFIPIEFVNAYLSNALGADQRKLLELYLTVPELQAIINYKARVFSGMKIKAENDAGDEVKIPQLDVFDSPNPIQTFREFASQYYILRAIFGNEFIHPVYGVRKESVASLWNLPPMNARVVPVSNNLIPFNMTKVKELIKEYKFYYAGNEIIYKAEEIIHYNDNQVQFDKDKILLGDSKLRPLIQACDNIKHAYEARGILIQNSALGILSNETVDAQGVVDLDPKEKDAIQEDYRTRYGLTKEKYQIIITNARLKFQSLAVNVGNLKLFEEVESDFRTIANAHNFPPEILQPKPGSSLNPGDKNESVKQLYNEAIIPEANEWLQGLANWMQLDVKLKANFNHIAVLQEDFERKSKSINWVATGLAKAIESGIVTVEDAQKEFKKYIS